MAPVPTVQGYFDASPTLALMSVVSTAHDRTNSDIVCHSGKPYSRNGDARYLLWPHDGELSRK